MRKAWRKFTCRHPVTTFVINCLACGVMFLTICYVIEALIEVSK